jgi:hypothetical protein
MQQERNESAIALDLQNIRIATSPHSKAFAPSFPA